MGIIDTIKTIKKVQTEDVIMVFIGKFMYSYCKDAYIMSYIFGYKLKIIEDNIISFFKFHGQYWQNIY